MKRTSDYREDLLKSLRDVSYARLYMKACMEDDKDDALFLLAVKDIADAQAVAVAPPAPPVKRNNCNRHSDCAEAEAKWKERNPAIPFAPLSFHCHDDECEDCFGS